MKKVRIDTSALLPAPARMILLFLSLTVCIKAQPAPKPVARFARKWVFDKDVHSTGIMYKERESGNCEDSGGGWNEITSIAACETAAAALGWSDTKIDHDTYPLYSDTSFPPGCLSTPGGSRLNCKYYSNTKPICPLSTGLVFNYEFSGRPQPCGKHGSKCACTLICPPGTFQDQPGQTSCKKCASDTFSTPGASSCLFGATSCPAGTYASGSAACDLCQPGMYNDKIGESLLKDKVKATEASDKAKADLRKSNPDARPYELAAAGKKAYDASIIKEGACKVCSDGKVQSFSGASDCDLCVAGRFTYSNPAYTSSAINHNNNPQDCFGCYPGKYVPSKGATRCIVCETGKFQELTPAIEYNCKFCAAGKIFNTTSTGCVDATAAVVVTVTLTGVTEEQVTAVFKKALKSTIAAKAGVDPSHVTLTFVYTKAATRRLAAGDTVAVTATIAVADAAAATKVSADVVKVKPEAFVATLKTELVKAGSDVDLTAVTATIAPPVITSVAPKDGTSVAAGSTLNTVNRLGAALVAVAVAGLV